MMIHSPGESSPKNSSLVDASTPLPLGWQMMEWCAMLAGAITIAGFLAPYVHQDALLVLVAFLVLVLLVLLLNQLFRSKWTARIGWQKVVVIIFLVAIVSAAIAVIRITDNAVRHVAVAIKQPADGELVPMRYLVQGTVGDPSSTVRVVVHPQSVPWRYVQPAPVVGGDGGWQVYVGFGTDAQLTDEEFEVIAIATHENSLVMWLTGNLLRPGSVLKELPRNTNRSKVITVTRPKSSP